MTLPRRVVSLLRRHTADRSAVCTLYYANKVGHTRGAHPVYNGWAATFDFGPNDWGYLRYECLGGWGSW